MSESIENPFLLDDEFIRLNNSQDNDSKKNYKDECKNKLFLKKINENIFDNPNLQNINSNEENNSISLNKDKLYETFSLFQQFLNSSKVENSENGKNDENNIGEKIQQFLQEKRNEVQVNKFDADKKINVENKNKIYNTYKKEKDFQINTNFISTVDGINKYNKNKLNKSQLNTKYNTSNNFKINKNFTIKTYNSKEKREIPNIKQNFLLSNSIEKNFFNNKTSMNFNKRCFFESDKNIDKIGKKKTNRDIIESKSNYNIFEMNKNGTKDYFKDKIESNKKKQGKNNNKIRENKIIKANSFSKNNLYEKMNDIIRTNFNNSNNIFSNNNLELPTNRNKKSKNDNYRKSHSNSYAFLKINISPSKSPDFNNKKTNEIKMNNKNNNNKSNSTTKKRNNLIFSMKKMISSKSENCFGNNNNKKSIKDQNSTKLQKYNKDNININLNINQEIKNINYSSEKPMIETNFQKLIKINKILDNEDRNNNIKSSGNSYNKSIENIRLDNNKNIITEIKVKKKKNNNMKEQLIQAKIKELNEETEKFKEERIKITSLKNEYEKLSKKLKEDIEDFNKKKEDFEKYRQNENEMIKNKKINPAGQSTNLENNNKIIANLKLLNQTLLQKSKNDKETIKSLKIRINNLENIIKQKDIEIKKLKNNNNIINSHRELLNINNKKTKINDQLNSNKNKNTFNISKKEINNDIKNLFEKKIINKNDSKDKKKDINNFTVTNNFSKVYFDNINKKINKNDDNLNNSFSENQKTNKIKKKYSSNNNLNKIGPIKTKLNKLTKVTSPKKGLALNIINKKAKKLNNKNVLANCSERNSFYKKIEIPNFDFNYSKDNNKFDDNDSNFNINYNTCSQENNIFKNIKKIPLVPKPNTNRNNNFNNFIIASSNKIDNNKSKGELKPQIKINKIKQIKKIKTLDGNFNKKNQIINISSENMIESGFKIINNEKYIESENNQNISFEKSEEFQNNSDNNSDFEIINNDFINENEDKNEYDFVIPEKYNENNYELLNEIESDGKKINIYSNNRKEIIFKSGVRKDIFEDGYQLVYFPNGDKKQIFPDGKIVYYFNDAKTVQTTFSDGLNIFKFSNSQIEKHYLDGSKYIIFPNGTKRKIAKDGTEEDYISDEEEQIHKRNRNDVILDEFNKMENNELFMSYKSIDANEDF